MLGQETVFWEKWQKIKTNLLGFDRRAVINVSWQEFAFSRRDAENGLR